MGCAALTPTYILVGGSDPIGTTVWSWPLTTDKPTGNNAFGNELAQDDPDGNGVKVTFDLRFPGQQFDAETGLHYNYFRDYEPGTGRYVESDPIGLADGLSTFAYVGSSPVSFLDLSGEFRIRAEERRDFGGDQWVYWFDFDQACEVATVRNATTRGLKVVKQIARAVRLFPESSAGDNDIEDFVDWCRCLNADPHLKSVFTAMGHSSSAISAAATTFNEAEARQMTGKLRREFNQYVDSNFTSDCARLKSAYPWDELVDLARKRGRKHIGRYFE